MTFLRRTALVCALLFCSYILVHGAPARGGKIILRQPDGTEFSAILKGDEFIRILTTADGHAITKGTDGYYCYATYGPDGTKRSTGIRVGETGIPAGSKDIPFGILQDNASAKRKAAYGATAKETPIRRIGRMQGTIASKAEDTPFRKHGIVILAAFSDVPFQYTKGDFEKLLTQPGYDFNGATGCAKDYFDAQFKGQYEFEFEVSEIVTLSKTRAYYGRNNSSGDEEKAYEMVLEACRLADASVDFSKFDDDGDGEIDNVFVFFAGGDEAQNGDEDCVWSHAWYLVDGAGIPAEDATFDGVIANRYACSSELAKRTGSKEETFTGIGTFCHEYSHTFGLPDLYDTDYENSGGQSDALWRSTSLMDGGNYNNNGNTPPYYNAIEQEELGIEHELLSMGEYELSPIGDGGKAYRLNGKNPGEYYLLECREAKNWDSHIGGSGLLIYHIDRSKNMAGISASYKRELNAEERWHYNEINCNPEFQCADLIEAKRTGQTKDIFFPHNDMDFFQPTFRDGSESYTMISEIRLRDGKVFFNAAGNIVADNISAEAFQDCAIIQWSSKDHAETATVRYGSGSQKTEITVTPYSEEGLFSATLEGLVPGTQYKAEISLGEDGAWKGVTFTTRKYNKGAYPFIFLKNVKRNSDGTFDKGTEIPLRLYNAIDALSVTWSMDGEEITTGGNGYYRLEKSGTLKAVINSEDGGSDTIIKEMTVR